MSKNRVLTSLLPPCKHPSWNRLGIYVSRSCWDYVVKHVIMSSFLDIAISNITNFARNLFTNNPITPQVCYIRNTNVEKTRHFNMFHHVISTWPTNINATSVPWRVLAGLTLRSKVGVKVKGWATVMGEGHIYSTQWLILGTWLCRVQQRATTLITSLRCLYVCNRWAYADNLVDAVDQFLMN